jgi:elongation factor P--beta-lysine ligase
MESMSAMLRKMTKENQLEQLTFEDLFTEIEKMKATHGFQEMKKITQLSETLATRVGSLKNWNRDIKIFQELGASKNIIAQVFEYLESHPENTKTYQEILEDFKK